jgi:endonuclease/exonuclease/phosphatase family metal-dependent hydrolase
MPQYNYLRWKIRETSERLRTAKRLERLRDQLDGCIPAKDAEDNLLLATWNVRDFGKTLKQRRGWGARLPESWFYIAEILSRFDFVAVQEVSGIPEWQQVMDILGPNWDYIATDETDPKIGGNGERMVFLFDRRKVRFQKIAGEIVLPPNLLISRATLSTEGKEVTGGKQFRRTPFMASFQSGWLKFDICTVHIYYGSTSGGELEERVNEIEMIAKYLSSRADRALGVDRALFILGDFNIVSPEHKTMKALTDNGFTIPRPLRDKPSTPTAKHYDQIGFKTKPEVLSYAERTSNNPLECNAGVVEVFSRLFMPSHFGDYRDFVKANTSKGKNAATDQELKKVYREWRTYQISDHYPMWVRLQTDSSGDYLAQLIRNLENKN